MPDSHSYWSEHGDLWGVLYDRRPHFLFYYRAQELVWHYLIATFRPETLLEYGCGTGRVLRLLRTIPQLDIYGADQSASMLAQVRKRSEGDVWNETHLYEVNGKRPKIPCADKEFRLVLTNEALLHTPPTAIGAVIDELIRLSSGLIAHIEPIVGESLEADDHFGCYAHDFERIYRARGLRPVIFQRMIGQQSVIIVPLDEREIDVGMIRAFLEHVAAVTAEVQANYDDRVAAEEALRRRSSCSLSADPASDMCFEPSRDSEKPANMEMESVRARLAIQAMLSEQLIARKETELTATQLRIVKLRQSFELFKIWRPLKLAARVRTAIWKLRSAFDLNRRRFRMLLHTNGEIFVDDILSGNRQSVPFFLILTQRAFVRLDDSGRYVFGRGVVELFGFRRWEVVFASGEFDGRVVIQVGAHRRIVSGRSWGSVRQSVTVGPEGPL